MKKRKNDWYVWGEWVGIFLFHTCYNFGLALELKRRGGVKLSKFAADYQGPLQKIYILKHEWEQGGQWYLDAVLKNPKKLERDLVHIEQAAGVLYKLNKQLMRVKASKRTLNELGRWYDRFHKAQHELWCAGQVVNLLELNQSYLSSYLRSYIEKQAGTSISEKNWQILITPTQFSYAQKEERAFLKLVTIIEKNKKLTQALKNCKNDLVSAEKAFRKFPSIWKKLYKHYMDFRWVEYGWSGPALSLEHFLDLVVRWVRSGRAVRVLKKMQDDDNRLSKTQPVLERKWIGDTKHRTLFKLLRRILFDKAYRVDALYQGYYAMEPILREMAKYLSISMNQLYTIYGGWMPKIIKAKKVDVDKLNEIQKYSAFIKEGNQLRFYVGKQAKKKMAPILKSLVKEKKSNNLQGEVGYPGKVHGRVKIIASAEDMHKMENGNILVSQATDPSILPAMKKAAAFVTDMGGLTCHAAIVAREMKKPCIIGTKVATKVLKDGDKVEVDAGRGIVTRSNGQTRKKLIILDFHGVVLKGSMKELAQWAAKVQGRSFKEMYDIIYWKWFGKAVVGKITEFEFFKKAAKEVGMASQWKKMRRIHLDAQKLNHQVAKYAEQLQKRNYEILLLSQNTPPQFREFTERFKLNKRFPHILNTFDLKLPKAHNKTLRYIMKKFKVQAKDCYFIDDSAKNLVNPKKIGMPVHLYKNFKDFRIWLERKLK